MFTTEEQYLGRLDSIIPTGSNDVYVVKDTAAGDEILIPAVKSIVLEIDRNLNKMRVDLPEGL